MSFLYYVYLYHTSFPMSLCQWATWAREPPSESVTQTSSGLLALNPTALGLHQAFAGIQEGGLSLGEAPPRGLSLGKGSAGESKHLLSSRPGISVEGTPCVIVHKGVGLAGLSTQHLCTLALKHAWALLSKRSLSWGSIPSVWYPHPKVSEPLYLILKLKLQWLTEYVNNRNTRTQWQKWK